MLFRNTESRSWTTLSARKLPRCDELLVLLPSTGARLRLQFGDEQVATIWARTRRETKKAWLAARGSFEWRTRKRKCPTRRFSLLQTAFSSPRRSSPSTPSKLRSPRILKMSLTKWDSSWSAIFPNVDHKLFSFIFILFNFQLTKTLN